MTRSSAEPVRVFEYSVGVETPVAARCKKKRENRKRPGSLSLEVPLVTDFDNTDEEDIALEASVPEPVTG